LKHLNAKSNPSKQIRSIGNEIVNIRKLLKALEYLSKHSNANSNHLKRIERMQIRSFRMKIRTIRMQIQTIQTGFKAFESKFDLFERDSKHWNANSNPSGFEAFEIKFESFEKDSKHYNGNCNHSQGIRSIRTQILKIPTRF